MEYISLMQNNSSAIPYYLIVFLKDAKNTKPSTSLPYQGIISPYGAKQLFTVTRENTTKSCSFTYSYRYLYGSPNAKHSNKIAYLIPLKNVGATKISKVRNVAQTLNKEIAETWNCYSFIASPGDTVYASRRGIVLEVADNYEVAGKDVNFTIKRNSILMQHKDGTLARYSLFKKGCTTNFHN